MKILGKNEKSILIELALRVGRFLLRKLSRKYGAPNREPKK